MPTSELVILLNEGAGRGEAGRAEAALRTQVAASGLRARVVAVSGAPIERCAVEVVRDTRAATPVAAGGDGTVRAVATAVAGTGRPFGIVPLGTRNHFARDLGLPLDLEGAVAVLRRGAGRPVDAGDVNGLLFLNNASLGLYPRCVRERRLGQTRARWTAMIASAWRVARRRDRLHLRVRTSDGAERSIRASIVLVGNNRCTLGGLDLGTRPSLSEGALSVVLAAPEGVAAKLGLVRKALLGRLEPGVDYRELRTPRLVLESERTRLPVALDGEGFTLESPLTFRSRAGVLRVLAHEAAR